MPLLPISRALFDIQEPNDRTVLKRAIRLSEFIPRRELRFFTYPGSLTTPECPKSVTWFIFEQIGNIGRNQVRFFKIIVYSWKNKTVFGFLAVETIPTVARYQWCHKE